MRGVGLVGVPGNSPRCHFVRKQGVALRVAASQPRRGARAQPLDGGSDQEIRQRHPFGAADDFGYEAHVTTPVCDGSRRTSWCATDRTTLAGPADDRAKGRLTGRGIEDLLNASYI